VRALSATSQPSRFCTESGQNPVRTRSQKSRTGEWTGSGGELPAAGTACPTGLGAKAEAGRDRSWIGTRWMGSRSFDRDRASEKIRSGHVSLTGRDTNFGPHPGPLPSEADGRGRRRDGTREGRRFTTKPRGIRIRSGLPEVRHSASIPLVLSVSWWFKIRSGPQYGPNPSGSYWRLA
jgi:hypothetical protein